MNYVDEEEAAENVGSGTLVPSAERAGSKERKRLVVLLFAVTLAVMIGKIPGMPTADFFAKVFTLEDVPVKLRTHMEYVLFTPLATVVVLFFRLTLGLAVFGMWRPIILAVAFHLVGLTLGLTFLFAIMSAIVLVRPLLRVSGLHNYARNSVAMGGVVALLLATVAVASRLHIKKLLSVAHFPIISLCLISESFAMTLYEKGPRRAVWRAAATIFAGIIISLIFAIPGGVPLLLRFPELIIAQIGAAVFIAEFANFRLLEGLSPRPRNESQTKAVCVGPDRTLA